MLSNDYRISVQYDEEEVIKKEIFGPQLDGRKSANPSEIVEGAEQ